MRHTPRPWRLERAEVEISQGRTRTAYAIVNDSGQEIARTSKSIFAQRTNDANATLLLAAPQMLEALQSTFGYLDACLRGNKSPINILDLANAVRSAIAAATQEDTP